MSSKLTVIIPVYNGMPFLKEAVESILNQTYSDFRLLIIDDGSTDDSFHYLQSLSDDRLELWQQRNLGLCTSLNRAIQTVDSEFIARLDQDDVALPSRLQEQIEYLIHHPETICVLSNISRIVANGKEFGSYTTHVQEPISDYDPDQYGCIVHSTICFRRQAFVDLGGYRSQVYPVDDYDLLLRFWETGKVAVINKPLVKYRVHSKASTFKVFREMQIKTRYVTTMSQLRQTGNPELSLLEFMQTLDQTHFLGKLARHFEESGMLHFRKAGLLIGEGQMFLGGLNLMIAVLYYPHFAIKRLMALCRGRMLTKSDLP